MQTSALKKVYDAAEPQSMPEWFATLLANNYIPYIATSSRFLSSLNTSPFGVPARCFLVEDPNDKPFHEAYLLSNALSYEEPDLKMPHWVLIDCVLMQTAVIGFMKPKDEVPESMLKHYKEDPSIDFDALDYIPISGQCSSPGMDGKSLVGFTLFSLRKGLSGPKGLGLHTKALGYEVCNTTKYNTFYGIAQYDNLSMRIHGRFAKQMEIYQPIVPLHPCQDMTLVYKLAIDFDPFTLDEKPEPQEPTFWLNAKDTAAKVKMQEGIAKGCRYFIAPPYQEIRDGEIFLPIIVKEP